MGAFFILTDPALARRSLRRALSTSSLSTKEHELYEKLGYATTRISMNRELNTLT